MERKSILLLPLSIIYGFIVYVRNKLFDLKILSSREFDVPVISVGNITVGGTGKTPTTEYLISLMKKEFTIATLSRGYKRKTHGYIVSTSESKTTEIGDEPKQIKQKFPEVIVSVCESRVKGIVNLMRTHSNINVIILDDAYQHRHVSPGVSVLLIDYNRPISKDFMLPYGGLRENPHQMKRAGIILVTKCPRDMKPIEKRIIEKDLHLFPYQSLYFTTIKYCEASFVYDKNIKIDLTGKTILLVTGIANPAPLLNHLKTFTKNIQHISFPDHYTFHKKDLDLIVQRYTGIHPENKIIITTEKDAMRIMDFEDINDLPAGRQGILKNNLYYIPIETEFLYKDSDTFNKQILNYVRTNKKHSDFYSR
ncbi:MAG: tetraacyldisaccharide 4'-kinase [Bacteroidia bacterium]|nr:tetraacyldisaccharide 4'-kinase [Bacteroidia bacterium]